MPERVTAVRAKVNLLTDHNERRVNLQNEPTRRPAIVNRSQLIEIPN